MKKLFIIMFLSAKLFAGTLNIAVAANVSYALKPLIEAFNKLYPDIDVEATIGSSGKLTAQILHHAPYELFLSANLQYPQKLYKEGFATSKPVVYAKGGLAYVTVQKRDLSKGMALLEDSSIKKIAVANPKTAPYGIAAREAIKHANIYENVKSKFVYGESIAQTLSYAIKAADIGIVAKSSLFSDKLTHLKKGVNWLDVESELYKPISQGMVLLNSAKKDSGADEFYRFMLSKQAKDILQKFGYTVL